MKLPIVSVSIVAYALLATALICFAQLQPYLQLWLQP